MQFGRKETHDIDDAPFDERDLGFVLFERIRIDDRCINTPEVEQRIDILGCTACHDGNDVKLVLLIDDAGNLCRQPQRSAFDESAGEPDSPCIDALLRNRLGRSRHCRRSRRLALRGRLSAGTELKPEQRQCYRRRELYERHLRLHFLAAGLGWRAVGLIAISAL